MFATNEILQRASKKEGKDDFVKDGDGHRPRSSPETIDLFS